ncbi:MAG: hypothetical protein RIR10_621 [Planctomycetota bacterium]|jgi:hypothetical protein
MDGVVGYIVSVVVIPALVAAAVAAVALVTPLRRRAWAVECFPAMAVALAFLVSFTNELGWTAIARQVMTVEGDDAPFERWHRLGLAALVLMVVAIVVTAARARMPRGGAPFVTMATLGIAGALAAQFVQFPQPNLMKQLGLAALILASSVALQLAGGAVYWIAWGAFGIVAALAGLGGFASLAVMSGAVSVASLLIAILAAIGGKFAKDAKPIEAVGALLVVCAVMLALASRCGDAYDHSQTPDFLWWLVPLVPGFALIFTKQALRASSIAAATFWRTLGAALVGIAVLGAALAIDASKAKSSDDADDPYADMYGA